MMYKALDFLVRVADARVPQLSSIVLGTAGAGLGLLYATRPTRFDASPTLHLMIALLPPIVWGLVFFAAGVVLITVAIIDYRKVHYALVPLGLLMYTFTLLTAIDVFSGQGIGIGPLFSWALGTLCWINVVASVAPVLRETVRPNGKTVGVEKS